MDKKFEGMDTIKDGSTGEYAPGYHMIEVAGLSKNEKLPIPVYTRLFSALEEGFVSVNEEYLRAIEYLGEKYNKKGIKRTAYTGYMKITIPGIENKELYLVVIKSEEFLKDPMMLLTNMIPSNEEFTKMVNKVYICRWKIEEYFRYKKQQFGFEKELVRSLNSIRTLNVILTIVIGFIGMFSDNQKQIQYLVVFEASESSRKNEEIVLVFYAVERGLKKIFQYNFNGIKNKKEKGRRNIIENQLSLFE